jgi:hypothetical protein
MSFEPDASQRLLLWRLAVSDQGAEFLKEPDLKGLDAKRRQILIREGLIVDEPRKIGGKGKALSYLKLTDKGWAWCQAHLGETFKFPGKTPKLAGVVLERMLGLLQRYFEVQDHTTSFGEFVLQSHAPKPTAHAAGDANGKDARANGIASQVRAACHALADGRENTRIRLADLRHRVRAERQQLDEALLDMERSGELSLYELNDPRDIQEADREAALRTSAGNPRHVVYFGGQAS